MTEDLTGKKLGLLMVTSRISRPQGKKGRDAWFLCTCECGNTKEVRASDLRRGKPDNCGCITREKLLIHLIKHGHRPKSGASPEYDAWSNMKKRCKDHELYFGRGIKVCERWRNSFENFLADMGKRPNNKHSIDRKDNDGDYKPSNCRWATNTEQVRNRRNSRKLTYNGETKSLWDWADDFDIIPQTLITRIFQMGWSVDKALTTPVQAINKRGLLEHDGLSLSVPEWAELLGIGRATIYKKLNAGLTIKDLVSPAE